MWVHTWRSCGYLKPENKSVVMMCPGLSSTLSMVSICTTSLKWVPLCGWRLSGAYTNYIFWWSDSDSHRNLVATFWWPWVRFLTLQTSHDQSLHVIFSNLHKPKVTLQKMIEQNLFLLLFCLKFLALSHIRSLRL